jgi:cyclase
MRSTDRSRNVVWSVSAGVLLAGAVGAWLAGTPRAQAQEQDFSKVEVKATLAAGRVYYVTGSGGNIGAQVGEDGILLVDDQYEPLAEKIKATLTNISAGGKLHFIVNTHWHSDHTGGNKVFGAEAPIIAQNNVRKRLSTDQTVMGRAVKASPKVALPILTFDQSVSIWSNGEEVKVVHFPAGHTDGDSVVFFTGSNVVHMGDLFFAGRYPFVDLGSGGSVEGLIDDVKTVIGMLPADIKVIPGHGPLSTVADLKAYHDALAETVAIVRGEMKAGKSLEAIQAAGLPDKYKEWGSGFVDTKTWLAEVHDSLAQHAKAAKQ